MRIEYQNMINLLENTANQPSKFKTKNWVEVNDDAHGTCNTNSGTKTTMLKSSPEAVSRRCSSKIRKIHRKTLVPESHF